MKTLSRSISSDIFNLRSRRKRPGDLQFLFSVEVSQVHPVANLLHVAVSSFFL